MKIALFLMLTLLFVILVVVPNGYVDDSPGWSLPEGTKARIGKGVITEDIAYSPDGSRLAVASAIGIWLYDTTTYQEVALFTGHTDWVNSIAFSPDENTLVSGSRDGTMYLWDAITGKHKDTLTGHRDEVNSVAFSPDSRTLVSASWDGTVRLWNAVTGEQKGTLTGHTDWVNGIAFSPDGRTLAGGSRDSIVYLWDTVTGEHKMTLTGHTAGVSSVAFSPDGSTLASGSYDDTIRLWDGITGRYKWRLTGHTDNVGSIAFSADGQTLVSGSLDGTVLLWEIPLITKSLLLRDVNRDGVVDISDVMFIGARFGQTGQNDADVNGDGVVNILDLVTVAGTLEVPAAAPSAQPQALATLTAADVQGWLAQAGQLHLTDVTSQKGVIFLKQLLAALTPKATTLLPNYPNPFNPETWIPYRLAQEADVTLTVYDIKGALVRQLDLGNQLAGYYTDRTKAAYWNGRNERGELVTSGVYFYQLRTKDYTAIRRMVIVK